MPLPEPDQDADLMLKAARGDLRAFESLVEKHKHGVLNYVYRMIGDATEAEDIAQNVFIQAFKAASRYKPSARFTTWLYTIARHLCLNEIRRRQRHKLESLQKPADPSDPDGRPLDRPDGGPAPPDQALQETELEEKIQEALATLPENQRAALILRRYKDMPYEDIARVLGCSVPATKSLLFRARETMKALLKPYLAGGR